MQSGASVGRVPKLVILGVGRPISLLQRVSCTFSTMASRWRCVPSFAHSNSLCSSALRTLEAQLPPCQGSFVPFFLSLLMVSGGVGCLPGLAESGLEKSEHKFMACPLFQLLAGASQLPRPSDLCGLGVSFTTYFYVPCTALHVAHTSAHVFIIQLCEVGTHCTDENTKVREGQQGHSDSMCQNWACSLASV